MNLDDELRLALKRTEPAVGFTERVLARVESNDDSHGRPRVGLWKRLLSRLSIPAARWATAVVVLGLIAGSIIAITEIRAERQREAAQADAAKAQLMLALSVASEKVNVAQRKVSAIGGRGKGDK